MRIEQSIYVWGNKLLIKGNFIISNTLKSEYGVVIKSKVIDLTPKIQTKKHHNYKTVIILKESLTFETEKSY